MSGYDPETIEVEVKRLPEGLRGIISIQENKLRKIICRRIRPCRWEVLEELVANTKSSNPKALDDVIIGALEESYQDFLYGKR